MHLESEKKVEEFGIENGRDKEKEREKEENRRMNWLLLEYF